MPSKTISDHGYKNPDNDPRGPYRLTDLTSSLDRPLSKYEWHGRVPPKGRSWRISKEKADELERDDRIVFPSSGMPRLKRYLAEARQELRDLLTGIPDEHFDREIDFIQKVFPRLMNVFDYAEDETFYEYGSGRFRADVVLSGSIEAPPWVVIEVKGHTARNTADWVYQLRRYLDEFGCNKGFVISPELLVLVADDRTERFDLKSLTLEQAEEIFKAIERNAQGQTVSDTIPQRNQLVDLIEAVERAETNKTKGKSLEDLAHFLFESVAALGCKYNNLQTRSSEIDLVIEYDRSKGYLPLFEELGRFC
jgi:hypothetical protein